MLNDKYWVISKMLVEKHFGYDQVQTRTAEALINDISKLMLIAEDNSNSEVIDLEKFNSVLGIKQK